MQTSETSAFVLRAWPGGAADPVVIELSDLAARLSANEPVWVDVTSLNDPFEVGRSLAALPGLAAGMVAQLVNPPHTLSELDELRLVRWARFRVPTTTPITSGPQLSIAGLNILCGAGWVATFRAPEWEAAGGSAGPKLTAENLIEAAKPSWSRTDLDAHDLATIWLAWLCRSARVAAVDLGRYLLNSEFARWEGIESLVSNYEEQLRRLAFRVDALSLSTRGLQQPGVPTATAWFRPAVLTPLAAEVETVTDSVTSYLEGVRRDARAAVEQSRAEKAQKEAEASDKVAHRREVTIAAGAALFLGPSLVAAVFGAFPAWFQHDGHSRFAALVIASLELVVLSGLALSVLMSQDDNDKRKKRTRGLVIVVAAVVSIVGSTAVIDKLPQAADAPAKASPLSAHDKTTRRLLEGQDARLDDLLAANRSLSRQVARLRTLVQRK